MIYFAIALGIMFFLAMPEFCIVLCLLAGLVWLVMNFWGLFLVLLGIIFVILIFIRIGKSLISASSKGESEEDYRFILEIKNYEEQQRQKNTHKRHKTKDKKSIIDKINELVAKLDERNPKNDFIFLAIMFLLFLVPMIWISFL